MPYVDLLIKVSDGIEDKNGGGGGGYAVVVGRGVGDGEGREGGGDGGPNGSRGGSGHLLLLEIHLCVYVSLRQTMEIPHTI